MSPEEIYRKYGEALVFMGAGGPAEDWMNGIADLLYIDGVTTERDPKNIWLSHISLQISSDRTDLVLPYRPFEGCSKLPLWRLKNRERFDVMWLSDYIGNPQIRGVTA